MILEFFQSLNYRNFIFMQQLLDTLHRIIFLLVSLCLWTSCATSKQEESIELQLDQPYIEEIKKNPIPKSGELKISSVDELVDYLGIESTQEEAFRDTYTNYQNEKKQIIKSSNSTAAVKSSLHDREVQFLKSLQTLISADQYSRYISYKHQNAKQKKGQENF